MFFSVIIPVYNVLPYLREAVDSVLKQDFKGEFEVILVDDGSTDGSGAVCDEYAKQEVSKNIKIKVIHKPNGGLSSARNAGLDVARGEYIVFLDSDDWFADGVLSKFAELLGQSTPDLLEVSFFSVYPDRGIVPEREKNCRKEQIIPMKEFLTTCWLGTSAWRVIYRRNLLNSNTLRFKEGILAEDMLFNAQVSRCAKSIIVTDFRAFYYRRRENSIMKTGDIPKNIKLVRDQLYVYGECLRLAGIDGEERLQIEKMRVYEYNWYMFERFFSLPIPFLERRSIIAEWRKVKLFPIPPYTGERKFGFRYRFFRLLSLSRLTAWLIRPFFVAFPYGHPFWNVIQRIGFSFKRIFSV